MTKTPQEIHNTRNEAIRRVERPVLIRIPYDKNKRKSEDEDASDQDCHLEKKRQKKQNNSKNDPEDTATQVRSNANGVFQ